MRFAESSNTTYFVEFSYLLGLTRAVTDCGLRRHLTCSGGLVAHHTRGSSVPSYPFSLRGTEVPLRVSVFINTSIVVCTYPVPYQLIATVPRSVSQKVQATEAQPRSGEVSSGAKSAGQTRVDQKRKCYCLDPEPRIR